MEIDFEMHRFQTGTFKTEDYSCLLTLRVSDDFHAFFLFYISFAEVHPMMSKSSSKDKSSQGSKRQQGRPKGKDKGKNK